jgi:hypothetical protein
MKIVINKCYGGFGLSDEARAWIAERVIGPKFEIDYDIPRDHPALVACVETLGKHAAGEYANLVIVEVPDEVGSNWHVVEYNGIEHVAENHRTW